MAIIELETRVAFRVPLQLGLFVQPPALCDRRAEQLGDDPELGERAFGEAFVVRADDVDALFEILDAPTRHDLLPLHLRAGPVWLADDVIGARRPTVPHEPHVVTSLLRDLAVLAERIERNARGPLVETAR